MLSCINMEDKHFHYSVGKIRYAYPEKMSCLQFKLFIHTEKMGTGVRPRVEEGIVKFNTYLIFFLGECRTSWHSPHNYTFCIQQ